jgi:hypothetical protein
MNMDCVEFGSRLAAERIRRKLGTQREFGQLLGMWSKHLGDARGPVPVETVSRWEKGHRWPGKWHAYCLCHLMAVPPAYLGLDGVLSPIVVTVIEETIQARLAAKSAVGAERSVEDAAEHAETLDERVCAGHGASLSVSSASLVVPVTRKANALAGLDWERLASVKRNETRVDARVVQDQWRITRNHLEDLQCVSCPTLFDLTYQHMGRLRDLYQRATDHRFRHELGVMSCQAAVSAGMILTGLMEYRLAMETYRYCVAMATELDEPGLRSTGLILQAQLYGGHIFPRLRLSPARMLALMDAAETGVNRRTLPQARVFLYSTRSALQALLRNEAAAWRDVDVAHEAEARIRPDARPYICNDVVDYRTALEAGVWLVVGRPRAAIDLYESVIGRIGEGSPNILSWLKWSAAAAYEKAEEPEKAAPTVWDAGQLARASDTPFLIAGGEATVRSLIARHGSHPAVQELAERVQHAN